MDNYLKEKIVDPIIKKDYDFGYAEGYLKGKTDMLRLVQRELALARISRPIVIKTTNKKEQHKLNQERKKK